MKPKLPENYRNFPFLVTENATDPMGTLRCVACQICEKECPPQCIYIEKSKDKKPDATRSEVREWMSGNYCRCTGYHAIIEAICETLAARAGRASTGATP